MPNPNELSDTSDFIAIPVWLSVHVRRLLVRWVRGKMTWEELSEADKQALLKVAELFGEQTHSTNER